MYKRNKMGFTLIELLVVVLIIGILAAIALPQYQFAVEKARFMQAVTSMDGLRKASEVYYLENGEYPTSGSQLNIDVPLPDGYNVELFRPSDSYFALDMYVRRNGRQVLEYVHYLQVNGKPSQQKQCRVWADETIFHRLCQSVSGQATGTEEVGYTAYIFQ